MRGGSSSHRTDRAGVREMIDMIDYSVIVFIFWLVVFALHVRWNIKLKKREASLEKYGSDLDNWDTKLKTREIDVSGRERALEKGR